MNNVRAGVLKLETSDTDDADESRQDDALEGWAEKATIGIFVILVFTVLYFSKSLLLPIVAAFLVGMTLAPIVRWAAERGIPHSLTSVVLIFIVLGVGAFAITVLAAPVGEWIGRAPDIAARMREKLFVLDRPLQALNDLHDSVMPKNENAVTVDSASPNILVPLVSYLSPALGQIVIFAGTLIFYLVGQSGFRRRLVGIFADRRDKLRILRIANNIERDLAAYVGAVSAINFGLGVVVTIGAWLFGFPNPWIFGILATVLNYLPYIGAAATALVLFGVGLVTFPSLSYALLPPLAYVTVTTLEGHFLTPAILGRRLTLPPLIIFLALVFWTWMWGPIGSFLAVPISIVALVAYNQVFADATNKIPD